MAKNVIPTRSSGKYKGRSLDKCEEINDGFNDPALTEALDIDRSKHLSILLEGSALINMASTFHDQNRPFKFQVPYDGKTQWLNHFTIGRGKNPFFGMKPSEFVTFASKVKGVGCEEVAVDRPVGPKNGMGRGRGARRKKMPITEPGYITNSIRCAIGNANAHLEDNGLTNSTDLSTDTELLDEYVSTDFGETPGTSSTVDNGTPALTEESADKNLPKVGLDDIADLFLSDVSKNDTKGAPSPKVVEQDSGGLLKGKQNGCEGDEISGTSKAAKRQGKRHRKWR